MTRQASVSKTAFNTQLHVGNIFTIIFFITSKYLSFFIIFQIDSNRFVTKATCTYVYNQSEKCKHIAGLIYFVNHEDSLSKTSYDQHLGKPSLNQLNNEKYSKGKYFSQMFLSETIVSSDVCSFDINDIDDKSALHAVLTATQNDENDLVAKYIMKDLLNQVENFISQENCVICLKSFFESSKNYPVYCSVQNCTNNNHNFYMDTVVKNEEEIILLCCETLSQSKCNLWYEVRKLRLSASKNVHSIKSRVKESEESLIHEILYPTRVDTASVKYGIDNEEKTIKLYEILYQVTVFKIGVLVSKTQPWLCCSVDGIVMKNSCVQKLVEIKCPSSCIDKSIVNFKFKKCNVSYLKFNCDSVVLKQSSTYYTQCQVQMYVCGINECDLFLYTPYVDGSFCVTIKRDENFQ